MNDDYSKRGYLLPEGCKDLIDALNAAGTSQPALPPVTQLVALADSVSVRQVAALAGRKPFQVVADLMAIGIFADLGQQLDFETASRVLRKFGILAKRAPSSSPE